MKSCMFLIEMEMKLKIHSSLCQPSGNRMNSLIERHVLTCAEVNGKPKQLRVVIAIDITFSDVSVSVSAFLKRVQPMP